MGTATAAAPHRKRLLELRLVRGSIVEADARALVLGVFCNVDPAGAAGAVDRSLGGAIREFTMRRMFSGQLGQVFVLPSARSALRAEFVLFAGLGNFDTFGPEAHEFVAENVARTLARSRVEDFATVLLGAGSGIAVPVALEHQLRGFISGVRHSDPQGTLRRITLCEIDARKFAALSRAAARLAPVLAADDFEIAVDESVLPAPRVEPAPAPRARPRARTVATDPSYLLVAMRSPGRNEYECRSSLLTAGAKAAVLSGTTAFAKQDLRRLLSPIASGTLAPRDLDRLGTGLARLLIASSVREGLATMASRPLVIVHDREASQVPWEVLRIAEEHPALTRGLSRRYESDSLTVARWRESQAIDARISVLVVADPTGDLPGAAAEAEALRRILAPARAALDLLEGPAATRARVLAKLAANRYDVLHFAGHAYFDAAEPGRSGLICAGDEVLRGTDLEGLASLPALVFCNACEAARVRRRRVRQGGARGPSRSGRSASVAEAFLAGGVANFIGTHWPVSDAAALNFSAGLYEDLVDGAPLGKAVLAARLRVLESGSVDWADYVFYGNPAFEPWPAEPHRSRP
jgi:hypothetical protein